MEYSTSLIIGSSVFVILWIISAIIIGLKVTKDVADDKLRSEYRMMSISLTFMGAFCMWLMWICVFMHQMYPLITPQITA